MLKLWAQLGVVCLKYLAKCPGEDSPGTFADESGFDGCGSTGYTYSRRGEQKRIQQQRKRAKRISILGLWQPQVQFDYGLVAGSFNTKRYLRLLEWQACKAAEHLAQTGQVTVIVQDNASSHKSHRVQQHWTQWQEQGLFLFFLPPYSPQMNRIEEEWLHLKRDELAGRMFDNSYDLAMAVIAGVKARSERGSYDSERFKFNHV